MLRILNLVLALALAQGWQWARIAESEGLIVGAEMYAVASLFMILFVAHQLLMSIRQPAKQSEARNRAGVINTHLESLVSRYLTLNRTLLGEETSPLVRVNVMLPVVDWFGLRKRLQIFYVGCPIWCQYPRNEQDLYWPVNCGVVGWVYSRGRAEAIQITGRKNEHGALNTVPESHKDAVSDIKSILSVPILQNGKPLGVLTLDGQELFDRTLFDRKEVKELAEQYAQALPSLCFPNGVKPK